MRSPGDALSIVLPGTAVGLGGVGPYVVSKRRYGRLEVTRDMLRIGKERFAIADLEPAPLEAQAGGQRYTGTPRRLVRRQGQRRAGRRWPVGTSGR